MEPNTLKLLTLTVNHPEKKEIVLVSAVLMKHRCYGQFLEVMDIDSELFSIGSALFNKYGEIRPWLVDNEFHKGSGAWGRELNDGRLVFLLAVSVDAPYRKQGLGTWALEQLYTSKYIKEDDKILCWPSPLPRPPQDQWVAAFDGLVDFFRKAGYRRIGRTSFFGYSQDPDHPSRRIDRLKDYTPSNKFTTGPAPRFALHDAILNDQSEKIIPIIREAHTRDPTSVSQADAKGFRPIFLAVMSNNLVALQTLISCGLSEDDFYSRENGEWLTPLEACNKELRADREFQEIFMRAGWSGYSDVGLRMKSALKRAMGASIHMTEEEYVSKKKWGCTCGACLGGWLSPRTVMRLQGEAEMAYDMARETIDMEQMERGVPLDALSIEYNPILCYIPLQLWPAVYKTFIVGYGVVMKAIAQVLSRSIIPTEAAVCHELQNGQLEYFDTQAAQFYFNKGGLVIYALDAIIDKASDEMDSGFDVYDDDEAMLNLTPCQNDREFGIVRKNMGLDLLKRWGPYSTKPTELMTLDRDKDESDEGGEEDEDEDEDEEDEEDEDEDEDEEDDDEDEEDDDEDEEDEDEEDKDEDEEDEDEDEDDAMDM
ncbi:hypothetical protein C8J57DRAFT_1053132 [Mycena rebaudengoi]|nr:hypothetical protein C8J57DRAFT_1053132 [Mycena rebaudengoi]